MNHELTTELNQLSVINLTNLDVHLWLITAHVSCATTVSHRARRLASRPSVPATCPPSPARARPAPRESRKATAGNQRFLWWKTSIAWVVFLWLWSWLLDVAYACLFCCLLITWSYPWHSLAIVGDKAMSWDKAMSRVCLVSYLSVGFGCAL